MESIDVYLEQLDQVKEALQKDPSNEDLKTLFNDLNEVISLKRELNGEDTEQTEYV
jgi:hypothetical protein